MKQQTSSCEAAICVKHNKVKMYGNFVYLQNGQEFEIELFNPTQSTKLAKIRINGNYISNSGLVLKPGQRVYLERYLDTPKKFLFETYKVEDTKEVKEAIAKNGVVHVEFYDEKEKYENLLSNLNGNIFNSSNNIRYYDEQLLSKGLAGTLRTNSGTTNSFLSQSNLNSNNIGTVINAFTTSNVNGNFTYTANTIGDITLNSVSTKAEDSKIETGRVEKGGKSSQSFSNYSGDFYAWSSSSVSINILPSSQKPVESADLAVYCTECGSKNKKNWKFCPKCGTKF